MTGGRQRIDKLFEVALVLLGILSATEFQYVCSVPERQPEIPYAMKIYTFPIVALIFLWLAREIAPIFLTRYMSFKMALTEFCWGFWGTTLFYYLILNHLFGFRYVDRFSAFSYALLSVVLIIAISFAYERAEPWMNYFRQRLFWRLVRTLIIYLLAYVLASLFFL